MFDIGFFEILVIAVVALIVLGPEKMPHAVRMCAAYWGRLKRSIIATKIELEDQLALQDIKRQLQAEQEKVQRLIDQEQLPHTPPHKDSKVQPDSDESATVKDQSLPAHSIHHQQSPKDQ